MSNFKCDKCGMTNVDCGLGVFKTPREIELEKKLQIAEEALQYYADGEDISQENTGTGNVRYVVEGSYTDVAYQALQKMKEVNNDQ